MACKQQKIVSHSFVGWKLCDQGDSPVLGKVLSQVAGSDLFLYPHVMEKARELSWGLFYQGTNHMWESPALMT